jgi:hypothetical protein
MDSLNGKQYSSQASAFRAVRNYEARTGRPLQCAVNQLDEGCFEVLADEGSNSMREQQQQQLEKQQHSKTPWFSKVGKGVMLGSSGKKDSIFICDASNASWVAELPAGLESEANAAFIVTACNSFERMREALRELLAAEVYADGEGLVRVADSGAAANARAALQAAEGGTR